MKHRWRDGTTHVVFEPQELVEKLAALIPPPRLHGARYRGVFAPCARDRTRVAPAAVREDGSESREIDSVASSASSATPPTANFGVPRAAIAVLSDGRIAADGALTTAADSAGRPEPAIGRPEPPATPRPRRLAWAALLRRVFAIDVLGCPRCGARTRLLAALPPPDAASAILECLNLPSRAPPPNGPRPDELSTDAFDQTA